MKTYVLHGFLISYCDLSGHGRSYSKLAVTLTDSGKIVPAVPPKKNWRSRGKHSPGSGNYTNRWVELSELRTDGDNPMPHYINEGAQMLYQGATHVKGVAHANGERIYVLTLTKIPAMPGQREYYRVTVNGYIWKPRYIPKSPNSWEYVSAKRYEKVTDFSVADYGDRALQAANECYDSFFSQCNMSYDASLWKEDNYRCYIRNTPWTISAAEPQFSTRPESFEDEIELGIGAGVGFTAMVADAYVEAVAGIPDASNMSNAVNAIQLAAAGVSALKAIITRDVSASIGSLSDAWLAYRYSYGTTKADLEEAADLLQRSADLLFTDRIRCNGTVRREINANDVVTARCSISLEASSLSNFKSTVERYGAQLDAYALWDLVPYSFIVDWFLDIGGLLEYARKQKFARRVSPTDCWCSIERRWINEFGCPEVYYHRWRGQPPVSASSYVSHDPSGVTIVKRALDVLALAR